jgi:large subunit ribosomal protein L17
VNHGVKTKKLGRTSSHRDALMRNRARALIVHERIRTTLPKAKVAQQVVERLIKYGQTGTLAARRNAVAVLDEKRLATKLFDDIAPRFKDRAGGCTRILRLGPRASDGAEMAFLEFVVRKEPETRNQKESKEKK